MKYNKVEFERLINEILRNAGFDYSFKIWLLIDQNAKKWYEKKYTSDFEEIEEGTIYGISFSTGGSVEFDFKTGKMDNLLKSFLIKFASRQKAYRLVNGYYQTISTRDEVMEKIKESNKDRVYMGLFYTTLYGIGMWAIFSTRKDMVKNADLSRFLTDRKVPFSNEWSDAGWVYRFKIGKDIELNNKLLTEFKESNHS